MAKKKLEDMGEEEIRARIDLAKFIIQGSLGAILTLLVGYAFLIIKTQSILAIVGGGVIVFFLMYVVILRWWIRPAKKYLIELAMELDRRKTKRPP